MLPWTEMSIQCVRLQAITCYPLETIGISLCEQSQGAAHRYRARTSKRWARQLRRYVQVHRAEHGPTCQY
jgi:hypothetical protein